MDRPGHEILKEYRTVVEHLIDTQGWRYKAGKAGAHSMLYPADVTKSQIPIPGTPSDNRSFKNFIAQVRRAGGIWPPDDRK